MSTRIVGYEAVGIVMHRPLVTHGTYSFVDPADKTRTVALTVADCDGVTVQWGSGGNVRATREMSQPHLAFSTFYELKCEVDVDRDLKLVPSGDTLDWTRSSEGRRFLEDRFLMLINYFFENVFRLRSRSESTSVMLRYRPIGPADIFTIEFELAGVKSAQGNGLLGDWLAGREPDWPPSVSVAAAFQRVPMECSLLHKAACLITMGFYQEAIIVSFAVFDAKIQEFVRARSLNDLGISEGKTTAYLRNITQGRIETLLDFVLKCLDGHSLRDDQPELANELNRLNSKRNNIMHNGHSATRNEAIAAVTTVAKALVAVNELHGATFEIPKALATGDLLRHF